MPPLPYRIDTRRGDRRPHHRRTGTGRERGNSEGPLPYYEVRVLVRLGRLHALPGHERAEALPRGFRPGAGADGRARLVEGSLMSLVTESDYGPPRSKATTTVTLTIDGKRVTVPQGTSVLRAAMEAGTQIPKLCSTDMLEAFGSCRLCLVEIGGRPGTPASCTTQVVEGMAVHTHTERLKRLRRGVMELYISDHPLDCLTCAANGDCELQDMAGAV